MMNITYKLHFHSSNIYTIIQGTLKNGKVVAVKKLVLGSEKVTVRIKLDLEACRIVIEFDSNECACNRAGPGFV